MANPTNNTQSSSRGTATTSTTPDSRLNARPHTVFRYRGMKRESVQRLDSYAASLRQGMQASVRTMSNSQLLDEAKLLNTRLFESKEEIGPQEKEAIAETLILMRQELAYRIQKAAEHQKTTQPVLEHIKWEGKGGHVNDIYPFFMVDYWSTFVKTKSLSKFILPKSAEIAKWTNTKLIEEAEGLNNIFQKYLTAKEKTKKNISPIADTLIVMHNDMDRRIGEATRKQMKFPPILRGVTWLSENLAGIAEGVSPFSMIDIWSLYKSSKQRPKRLVKRYSFGDEVIEGDVPQKPKKCIVPTRITEKKAADRARKAIDIAARLANFKGELWYYCILHRMGKRNADMWWMDQNAFIAAGIFEKDLLVNFKLRIEKDAAVKITKIGNYTLSTKQITKLNKIDKDWARKIVYPEEFGMTKHRADLECIKLAKVLAKPELDKYWVQHLKNRNASRELLKIIRDSWCDDRIILTKLSELRKKTDDAFSQMKTIENSVPNCDTSSTAPYLTRKICSRWKKAVDDNNSFLNCKKKYGNK
ncbi:MAG: hypothetical protein K8R01_05805 [Methanococcoides sp.]|nr:hypothetical protein [Methanococcoides sp.]